MIKKIENLISNGDYSKAADLIQKELSKSFNFNDKKSGNKYVELHKLRRQLISRLDAIKKRKKSRGKGEVTINTYAQPIINYLIGTNKSSSTKIPRRIKENESLKFRFNELASIAITKNPIYLDMLYVLTNVIDEEYRILLFLGETGVGKTYLAKKIHYLSNRRGKVFKVLDCSKLSENLLESEIFGHVKGAYTGAVSDRNGALKTAEGGSLFIDEIHRASENTRNKLLNYFDEKEFSPVGSDKIIKSNVRIIIGTNRDLDKLRDSNKIEEDFYYRIQDRMIKIPPLRKRKEDIPRIIKWELEEYNRIHKRNIVVDKQAVEILSGFNWPGNHRQLHKYLLNKLDECEYFGLDILDKEFILSDPPGNIIINKNNPIVNLEDSLSKAVQSWKPDDGKFITDLLEPLLANIYMNQMNGKKTLATKIIQIDGSGGTNSTLDQRLEQYKTIHEKFLKN